MSSEKLTIKLPEREEVVPRSVRNRRKESRKNNYTISSNSYSTCYMCNASISPHYYCDECAKNLDTTSFMWNERNRQAHFSKEFEHLRRNSY